MLLGMDPETLISLGIGATVAILIVALFGGGREEKVRSRVHEITASHSSGRSRTKQRPGAADDTRLRRRDAAQSEQATGVAGMLHSLELALLRAGWETSPTTYLAIGAGVWLVATLVLNALTPLPFLFALICGAVFSFLLMRFRLKSAIAARQRKFVSQLPEAVDLIVRGIKAGLPVTETIAVIGQDLEDPVASEFRDIAAQLNIGVSLDNALWAVGKRIDLPEFNFFVVSLAIQQETGGNLGELLENLSKMIRRREQLKLKIKAMSSEARASAMIIGSLPFIMGFIIYLVNSEYISVLFTDPRGWVMLGVGVVMLCLGTGIMAKMVRFEI